MRSCGPIQVDGRQAYTPLPQHDCLDKQPLRCSRSYKDHCSNGGDQKGQQPAMVMRKGKLRLADPYSVVPRKRTGWSVDPDLCGIHIWHVLMVVVILVDAALQPFGCFVLKLIPSEECTLFIVVDRIIWYFYLVDTLLQFFLQVDSQSEAEVKLTSVRDIACVYLQTDFTSDVVALLPWASLIVQAEPLLDEHSSIGRGVLDIAINLLRLTRLVRLGTLDRITILWRHRYHVSFVLQSLAGNMFSLWLTLHCIACAWALVGICPPPGQQSWTQNYWPDTEDGKKFDVVQLYVTSFYWAIVTTTSIGFGDITPSNTNQFEVVFAIISIIIVAIRWSIVIANAVELVRSMNAASDEHKMTMDTCNYIVSLNNLPKRLAIDIREYFQKRYECQARKGTRALVQLMSPSLQKQTIQLVFQDWIVDVPWFTKISQECVVRLILLMENRLYTKGELLPNLRQISFVQRGRVWFGGRMLHKGDCWGTDMTLDGLMRNRDTGKAKTFAEAMALTHSALMQVLKDFKVDAFIIKRFTCWMALRRMIKILAHKEKRQRLTIKGHNRFSLQDCMTAHFGSQSKAIGALNEDMRYVVKVVQEDFNKVMIAQQSVVESNAVTFQRTVAVERATEARLTAVEEQMHRMEKRMEGMEHSMTKAVDILTRMEGRLTSIEGSAFRKGVGLGH